LTPPELILLFAASRGTGTALSSAYDFHADVHTHHAALLRIDKIHPVSSRSSPD